MSMLRSLITLLACIAVSFAPGAVGARFSPGEWYQSLAKPALTPPGWVFPIVWTLLYVAMGVALYLLWTAPGSLQRSVALGVFAVQLVLNGAWSWIFFGLHLPGAAAIDIVALLAAILTVIALTARIRPAASALLAPYALWVGFATWLNLAIVALNPSAPH